MVQICLSRLVVCVIIGLALSQAQAAEEKPARRPNIVWILADDLGYSDLGCYGGEIRTPNLDRLAAGGVRFTQFYNTGRCCPTRASLLTGLYPHQAGLGGMTFDRGQPGYRGQLRQTAPTVAEVLRTAGYRTAMSGKWHLSLTEEPAGHLRNLNNQEIRETFAALDSYPTARGFEKYFGCLWGVVNFFDPFSLVEGTKAVRSVPPDFYLTDALTDRAISYVEEFSRGKQPFFLYLAYTSPHWPLHARAEDIARYSETYRQGYDAVRNARYRRQLELGLFDSQSAPLPEVDARHVAWEKNQHQAYEASAMAAHAAMVDRMDQQIGRLIDKLNELGQLDNTLVCFLSDNGASPEQLNVGGFDRPTETRDGRPMIYTAELRRQNIAPGPEITFAGVGPHWALAANTPFRYWKAQTYEGGVCTPLVVHWPAGLRAKGELRHQPGHVIDLMATAVEIAGAELPKQFRGEPCLPLEGQSLLPALAGEPSEREGIFFEHQTNKAVRQGEWKAVQSLRGGGRWDLYNLSTDRTETRDLSAKEPERLARMIAAWEAWAERAWVKPYPAPEGK